MTRTHRRSRAATTSALVLALAAALLLGSAATAAPARPGPADAVAGAGPTTGGAEAWSAARTRGSLSIRASDRTPTVGVAFTLRSTVTPRVRGRRVLVDRRVGERWVRVGRARTNSRGLATLRTTLRSVGATRLRATAVAYRGQPRRRATTSVTVVRARSTVAATVPAGPWTVGRRITVAATVSPRTAGRRVWLERRSGTRWSRVSPVVTTGSTGKASIGWTPPGAGTHAYRIGLAATSTRAGGTSAALTRQTKATGAPLTVEAPPRVVTGSVFEVVFAVGREGSPTSGTLTVQVPTSGSEVTPPHDLDTDPDSGIASAPVPTVEAGSTRAYRLRWRAPSTPTTLTLDATIAGVTVPAAVQVVAEPAGGGRFGDGLHMARELRGAPTEPEAVSPYGCTIPGSTASIPSFAQAIDTAQAWVDDAIVSEHAEAWADEPALTEPELIDEVVLAALADKRPGAALAASLRGHALDPSDPIALSNAAVAANMLNRPEWAIAFLRHAGTLGPAPSVGVDSEAVRLVNLGHAYGLMQRWNDAEATVRQALLVAPDSPHVHQQLARIHQCQRDREASLPHAKRALRIDEGPDDVEPGEFDYPLSFLDTTRLLDTSMVGEPPGLVLPTLPDTASELASMSGYESYYRTHLQRLQAEWTALNQQASTLRGQVYARLASADPAEARVTRDLIHRASAAHVTEATVRDAYDDWWEANDRILRLNSCHGQFQELTVCRYSAVDPPQVCSILATGFYQAWSTRFYAAVDATVAYHEERWRVATAARAALSDPTARQAAGLTIQANDVWLMINLLTAIDTLGGHHSMQSCFDAPPPPPDLEEEPGAETDDPDAFCEAGSLESKFAFEVDLKVAKVKSSCEKASMEVAGGVRFLEAFARVEQLYGTESTTTVFVGTKAVLPYVGSFDSAFYVEFDGRGRIADLGIEVGPELEAGKYVLVNFGSDKIRMSAMSIFGDPGGV
ncbi:hypothetical protein CLV56_0534 [Mumia flava]|uniref:Tetratricopeptide repeat protein n=1 Tax=Mumia flava TaxID=1348852 RepID=A0A0B2BGH3_9ACTN|nr:tetratricopeptide repeat protein [Mumia flava]PJJ56328.1 hypothetical protein CLV56_0534 [Mumia flava]